MAGGVGSREARSDRGLLKEYSGATECLVLRPVVQAYSALAAQHCRSNEG